MSFPVMFGEDVIPAYGANFLLGSLPSGLTYTNSSTTRTYFGSDGLLKTAVANEPIFEYDPVTRALRGMRWEMEQRTNVLTHSAAFDNVVWTKVRSTITANAAIAPDGTMTADALNQQTGQTNHGAVLQNPVMPNAVVAMSIFAKANTKNFIVLRLANQNTFFNLATGTIGTVGAGVSAKMTALSNGWYHCSVAINSFGINQAAFYLADTDNSTTVTDSGGIYLWGAQLETGASVSSYIPTAGSAVIRQPDVLTATSISPWYRQDEGTVVFEGVASIIGASNGGICAFTDGTTSERMFMSVTATGQGNLSVTDGGVGQAGIGTVNTLTSDSVFRVAAGYRKDNFAVSLNAGSPTTDVSGTIPTVNQLRMGSTAAISAAPFMGYARRFDYYNTRFPDATIKGLSRV